MKRKILIILITVIAMLLFTSMALAINFGIPDGGEHPYVGVVIFTADYIDYFQCSGTLIAPEVFLTAGHCAVDATFAWVTFEETPDYEGFPDGWLTGYGIAHPGFGDFALPNTYDVGVILLDEPIEMDEYGVLAPLGYLDSFENQLGQQDTLFEPVGYGVNSYKPVYEWVGDRYKGEQRIINLKNNFTDGYNVMLTNNPGKGNGEGGTCSGDSGGPILKNDTNMVVAINSFGIAPWCKGNDFAYRVDILDTYEFLDEYIDVLP